MNVISACPSGADETAARLRTGNVMPTPRCLPPTPKRSSGHHSGRSSATSTSLPPTAQALPVSNVVQSASPSHTDHMPKPSARMSLRAKVLTDRIRFSRPLTDVFFNLCFRLVIAPHRGCHLEGLVKSPILGNIDF